ncbi:DNA N-6-adenine-methyltransferase [Escherichia coli]|nr:DNA N-6-adenine-methyltransferase [Escherichia coli]
MSHPIINISRYHGGSDDWRTPYRLFRNLHREFGFTLDGAATKHDALLPRFTDDINRQSWVGERVFVNPPFSMAEKFPLKTPEADVCMSGSAQVKDNLLASVCIYKPLSARDSNVTPSSQIPSTSREERCCSAFTVCKLRPNIQEHTP